MRGNLKSPKLAKNSAPRHSPDGLGSGKSNLWSIKAREDIYSRRQNGEEWETICKDYPSRTRHAMQQQYSVRNLISTVLSKKLIIFKVMRKQNAAGNPSSTPTRRGGRRRRGVPRGTKWAAVNHPRIDSSEDGVDSDLQLDLELDDDDDEEYEGILPEESDVPEEDEPMVEEEKATAGAPVEEASDPSRRQSTSKEPLKRPYKSKVPKRSSISKKTLFPNLTSRPIDLIDPPSVDSDPKPVHPDSKPAKRRLSKRQADVDGSDSESRSSSRLSKRRKYSTEPSESFTILPTDSAASLRLLESFKLSGLFFHPDAIAKAKEDWRNMASAYESEKASRRETFEAALRRATRRANEAEHKLQDASQEYADKLKLEKEVQGKVLEAKEKELQAEKDKNKGSESLGDMTAQLSEKEEQLKLYDALRSQINTQVEQLKTLEVTALESSESIKNQHSVLTGYIDKFADEDWDDMGVGRLMGTVKKSGREIQDSNLTLIEKLEEVRGTWRRMSEAVSAFHAQFGAETSRSMDTSD